MKPAAITPLPAGAKRLQYVDVVKGIAIIWIDIYHLLAPCAFKTVVNHLAELFLAVFFFYSGFFYKPGKRSFGESIRKRAKSLMVPFFSYSLGFWTAGTVYLVATKNETIKEALLCLRNFFAGCIWNRTIQNWFGWEYYSLGKRYFFLADFWFLIALLFASILFFLIADKVLESGKTAICTSAALFAVTGLCVRFSVVLPYNIQLVPYWTALMLLGAYAGSWMGAKYPALPIGVKCSLAILLPFIGIVIAMLKAPALNQFRGSFGENEVLSMILCIAAAVPFTWGIGILFFAAGGKGSANEGVCLARFSFPDSLSFSYVLCLDHLHAHRVFPMVQGTRFVRHFGGQRPADGGLHRAVYTA